jgi:carboxymethylenebutenolidase
MSEWIKLKAQDGHEFDAYVAKPSGTILAAVVVVQEIFGVNPSIQSVVDAYAKEGFLGIAPAIFDRFEKNVQLGYSPEDKKKAYELMGKLNPDTQLLDIAASAEYAKSETVKKVGVVGYCFGGLMAWICAVRGKKIGFEPGACVGYYAGGIGKFATEEPSCPVMLHFGADDSHIGADQREAVAKAHPEVEICVYPGAGHAFANSAREEFSPKAAKIADARSLAFFKQHLA